MRTQKDGSPVEVKGDAVPNYPRIHGATPQDGTIVPHKNGKRAWCDDCGERIQLTENDIRWMHV